MRYKSAFGKTWGLALSTLLLLVATTFGSCGTKSWRLLTTETTLLAPSIISLFFTDPSRGWAITSTQLLETTDGGQSWTERLTDENKAFDSLTFMNSTVGLIVGSERKDGDYKPLIMRTKDGGKTWQQQPVNIAGRRDVRVARRLLSVSSCGSKFGWATGTDVIVYTNNEGQTWEVQREGHKGEDLLSVVCVNSERAWAVGTDGLILYTKDGGRSWSRQESGTKATLLRVRFWNDRGWVVGLDGTLLRTRDAGAAWERQQLNLTETLTDIFINDRRGWAVGSKGTILYSKDGGQTWQQHESPTSNNLISLFFTSPSQGWASGDQRTVLRFSN